MPERKGGIIVNPRILDREKREDRRDGMSTMPLEDARRAIDRGTARLRAMIEAREDAEMQVGPIEDQQRYPVIAYSQVPEDGSDVNQVRQNLDENAVQEELNFGYQRLEAARDAREVRTRRIGARHVPMYPKVVINT